MPDQIPDQISFLVLVIMFLGCGRMPPMTSQQRFDEAQAALHNAKSEEDRFYALNDVSKEGFVLGKTEEARKHAEELLSLLNYATSPAE